MTIGEKLDYVIANGYSCPFVEYYYHTNTDMFKIYYLRTKYGSEKIVLSEVSNGLEKSLDEAVKYINERNESDRD